MRHEVSKKTIEDAKAIEGMMNSFSFRPQELAEYLALDMHRTLQQTLTRFCVEWLKVAADENYGYDGRNEDSHILAKELLDGHDLRGLPMV